MAARAGFRMFFAHALMATFMAVVLSACTLAPFYQRPDAPVPSAFAGGKPISPGPALPGWQKFFPDPQLRQLLQLALANNRDLRIALLNIEKIRQEYRVQRADLLPTISAAGEESIRKVPADISMRRQIEITRQYSATLGFSAFELDLFGRVRSLSDQALETYYSAEDDAQAAQISLLAEVAALYYQLIADHELLALATASRQNRKEHLDLVTQRFSAGIASALELHQAQTAYEDTRSLVSNYTTKQAQDFNLLSLLIATPVPANLQVMMTFQETPRLPDLPEGLPSQLLERRPDIRAAEHRLKASNANIGAARANFFPRILLTGAFGRTSLEYGNLFTGPAKTWSFLPQITLPIFDSGRNIALLGAAGEEKKIAVAQYEKTIQVAFREVADALVQRQQMGELLAAEESKAKAARKTFELAEKRYKADIDNHLVLLDAQNNYLASKQSLISTHLLRENNALTLYKALGGGWE